MRKGLAVFLAVLMVCSPVLSLRSAAANNPFLWDTSYTAHLYSMGLFANESMTAASARSLVLSLGQLRTNADAQPLYTDMRRIILWWENQPESLYDYRGNGVGNPWNDGVVDGFTDKGAGLYATSFEAALASQSYSTFKTAWERFVEEYYFAQMSTPVAPQTKSVEMATTLLLRELSATALMDTMAEAAVASDRKPKDGSGEAKTARSSRFIKMAGGDVSTESWHSALDQGHTYQVNPYFVAGDRTQFVLTLPMTLSDQQQESDYLSYGADLQVRQRLGSYWNVGVHGTFVNDQYAHTVSDKNVYQWTKGVFSSVKFPVTERLQVGVGMMLDHSVPEYGNNVTMFSTGANVSLWVLPRFALVPHLLYFRDVDPAPEAGDIDFWNGGITGIYKLGESWNLTAGVEAILGYVDYRSTKLTIGSTWRF